SLGQGRSRRTGSVWTCCSSVLFCARVALDDSSLCCAQMQVQTEPVRRDLPCPSEHLAIFPLLIPIPSRPLTPRTSAAALPNSHFAPRAAVAAHGSLPPPPPEIAAVPGSAVPNSADSIPG